MQPARRVGKTALLIAAAVLASSLSSWAQITPTNQSTKNLLAARPVDRVAAQIDETQVVTLSGSRHPLAKAKYAVGDIPQDQRMERMVLVLQPDAAQEKALDDLIRAQQDPSSPYYHQWLTPQSFGKRFGVSQNDLNQVVNWLQGHGLEVDETPASGRSVVFSGTAGAVQWAFHTSIQKYSINGEMHYANATDPSIPRAFAGVVRGVVSMHDFQSAPQKVSGPAYTAGNGAHFLAPQDWNTIYNVNPLYGQGLDGTGQSIAVLGRVDVSLSDVRTFRSNSGLPANDPQMIVNGADPGFTWCDDEAESALDVEWAGAIAKNATVKFVTSKSGATDGIALSAQYAVTNNVAPIVSLSYGTCEANYSAAGNAFWNSLWAQAASYGMSVFVSSGDSGAAGCDSMNTPTATHGRGVNALCSSPYSTCVGATQFNDVYNPDQYWSPSNSAGMSSVLSYIPEIAWNESGWSNALFATGGGASTVYAKPSWQVAPGVPADGMRDVPDIAMAGAIHDAYIIEVQGQLFLVGGTSAATPSLASTMAMVLQKTGTPQGNVNPILYSLAALQLSSGGAAIFHDITSGNNSVPGVTGFNAGVGYDQATGLGSVDATMLVNHWNDRAGSSFGITASSSSLSVAQGKSSAVTLSETTQGSFNSPVTLSASGAPSGMTVTFSPTTLTKTTPVTATVAAGANTVAGSYTITVTGTGGGVTRSLPLAVTVVSPSFTLTPSATSATVAPGSSTSITLSVVALNGFNSAVALSVSGMPSGVTGRFSPTSIAAPGNGSSTLTLTMASSTPAGSYNLTITATGGGVTKTSPFGLTVLAPNVTLSASATSATVASGGSIPVTFTTATLNGFSSAVTLSVSGRPTGVTGTFSPASIAAPGNGSSTLTLAAASTTTAGTYNLTITATGGGVTKTSALSLTVVVPSFTLASNATSGTVVMGSPARFTLTTATVNGFKSAVALSVSGLPKGVTAAFTPTSIASPGNGSSTLTLTEGTGATSGTYNLTVTAAGGGVTKTLSLSLNVTAPNFTMTLSGASVSMKQGGSMPLTATTTAVNGFNSAVALAVSGLPKGVTATFSKTSIAAPGNGSSTLTLKVASGTGSNVGTSNVAVTGAGGGMTVTQNVALTVTH